MSQKIILSTGSLTKKYKDQTVVDQVSLNIEKGHIYGLLGRNGAGKTTIMKMILGLTSISSGTITIFNKPMNHNQKEIYPRIGSLIENPGFYSNLTATENLKVFARLRGTINKTAIQTALSAVGLPYNDKKTFSSYSLGMKQRLGIANAILNDPELLILDEPTNGLDPIGIAEIRTFLRNLSHNQGKTILISSHILSEIDLLADDIGILHEGRLLEECSVEVLKSKTRKYIRIQAPDINQVAVHLEQQLKIKAYSIDEGKYIRINEQEVPITEIGRSFYQAGILLTHLEQCSDTLEDYFKKVTGGVGIA